MGVSVLSNWHPRNARLSPMAFFGRGAHEARILPADRPYGTSRGCIGIDGTGGSNSHRVFRPPPRQGRPAHYLRPASPADPTRRNCRLELNRTLTRRPEQDRAGTHRGRAADVEPLLDQNLSDSVGLEVSPLSAIRTDRAGESSHLSPKGDRVSLYRYNTPPPRDASIAPGLQAWRRDAHTTQRPLPDPDGHDKCTD